MSDLGSEAGRRVVVKVMSKYYSGGVGEAEKTLSDEKQLRPDDSDLAPYISFLEGLLSSLRESNTNHAVVEALIREDANWLNACVSSILKAQDSLMLPRSELLRLDACRQALEYVAKSIEKGKKPSGVKRN
ncbi:MAG: hypothetical protein M1357_03145 [Candidatus Marsarchaeota archaeon]|nr:hypothetical protein [Candidatus Marsarchaeota archaeon]